MTHIRETNFQKLHNQVMELQGNIRVFCRVRPVLAVEVRSGAAGDVTEIPNDTTLVMREAEGGVGAADAFEFDQVFAPSSTQVCVRARARRGQGVRAAYMPCARDRRKCLKS